MLCTKYFNVSDTIQANQFYNRQWLLRNIRILIIFLPDITHVSRKHYVRIKIIVIFK